MRQRRVGADDQVEFREKGGGVDKGTLTIKFGSDVMDMCREGDALQLLDSVTLLQAVELDRVHGC